MRRLVCLLLLASAGSVCVAGTASAQSAWQSTWQGGWQSPWYVEASAGALWRQSTSYNTTIFNAAGLSGPGTTGETFDPGYVLNLGVGYRLPYGFRVEVEGGYAYYTTSSISPLSTNGAFPNLVGNRLNLVSGGGHEQYSGTANAFYDLPLQGPLVPYLGGGVGVVSLHSDTGTFSGPGVPLFNQLSGSATDGVVLAEAGVAITLNGNWSVVPAYRFEKVLTSGASNNINIFKLGVRYSPVSAAPPALAH